MKKKLKLLLALPLSFSLLTGCSSGPGDKDSVEDYLLENYQLTKKDYELTENGINFDITLKENSDIHFRVTNNESYDLFGSSYYFSDDYYSNVADYETRFYNPPLEKEIEILENGEKFTTFVGHFSNRKELNALFDDTDELIEHMQNASFPCKIDVRYEFDYPLRDYADTRWSDLGDYRSFAFIDEMTESRKTDALNAFFLHANDLQYDNLLQDFTKEEMMEIIKNSDGCIGVCHGNPERDTYEYYDDISASLNGNGISFPNFYTLLNKENIEVTGNQNHYSFTGLDQSTYEVWYDNFNGEGVKFTKDGTETDTNCFAHFSAKEIKDMTGLSIKIWKYDYQPNANVYAKDNTLSKITTFYLNDEEMSYDLIQEGYFHNTQLDYRYIQYNQEEDCYMIPIDIGWTYEDGSYPMICKEWVNALNGEYQAKKSKDTYYTKWKVNGNSIETIATFKDEISDVTFIKNKKKVKINYSIYTDGYVSSTYTIAIPLDDFVDLLGIKYTINQAEGSIYFTNEKEVD